MSLIGEVGTGKTTVLRTLLRQLEQADYQVAFIFNPCLSALELLQAIHREFGVVCPEGEANLARCHDSLNRFLLEQRQQGKTVVLVIDEAQNLEPSVLEQLRLLSNLETETEKLLQLIIVGQPELDEVLGRHELRQLKQRLTVRYRLTKMDAEDTAAYIRHRLKIAGFRGAQLFSEKARQQIYRLTQGLPRLINILCDRALLVAYTREQELVDHKIIAEARAELDGEQPAANRRWRLFAALGCAGAVLLLLVYWQSATLADLFSRTSPSPLSQAPPAAVEPSTTSPERSPLTVDPQRLTQIKQRLIALDESESVKVAASAILKRWGRPGLEHFDAGAYRPLEAALQTAGINIIRFQGRSDELLAFDTPPILLITLPNMTGRRYLGVLQFKDNQLLTAPALSADGWLPVQYLSEIWFGKAVIPWSNFEHLPYLDSPGQQAPGVSRIQELLSLAGYPNLTITGVYDEQTVSAVSNLQRRTGLAPDGRLGAQTLLHLYRLVGLEMPQLSRKAPR